MDKKDIIAELDKLKLKIMLDSEIPSELDKYKKWIDKLHLKGEFSLNPWRPISNEKWMNFALLKSCVDDLYGEKHDGQYLYHRDRPEIRQLIVEIISMVLFYQDELEKK